MIQAAAGKCEFIWLVVQTIKPPTSLSYSSYVMSAIPEFFQKVSLGYFKPPSRALLQDRSTSVRSGADRNDDRTSLDRIASNKVSTSSCCSPFTHALMAVL